MPHFVKDQFMLPYTSGWTFTAKLFAFWKKKKKEKHQTDVVQSNNKKENVIEAGLLLPKHRFRPILEV